MFFLFVFRGFCSFVSFFLILLSFFVLLPLLFLIFFLFFFPFICLFLSLFFSFLPFFFSFLCFFLLLSFLIFFLGYHFKELTKHTEFYSKAIRLLSNFSSGEMDICGVFAVYNPVLVNNFVGNYRFHFIDFSFLSCLFVVFFCLPFASSCLFL